MSPTLKKPVSALARHTSGDKKAVVPVVAKRAARSRADAQLANRVIYHFPLEPRHLTRRQIAEIVEKVGT